MSDQAGSRLERVEGRVKWFDRRKGYGFIIGPDKQDIFVHFSVIAGEGYRVLKDDALVIYDAALTETGWKASSVQAVGSPDKPEIVVRQRDQHTRTPRI